MFAFYPQFLPDEGPVLAWTAGLALLQVGVETALYLGLAAAVAVLRAGSGVRGCDGASRRSAARCSSVSASASPSPAAEGLSHQRSQG
jgi:hypothetical protein